MNARLFLVAGLLVGACGSPRPTADVPQKTNVAAALFQDRCETCHTEADLEEGRPQLIAASLDPKQANVALKRVLNGTMPPGDDDHLSHRDKLVLGDWLCERTQRPAQACRALVHNERRFAPNRSHFLTTAKRTSGTTPKDDVFAWEIEAHMRASVAAQVLDPSMITLVTGMAMSACASSPAFQACLDAYLDAIAKPIPPPPTPEPR